MQKKTAVIIMHGYPATGKTFVAKKLERLLKEKYKIAHATTLDIRKKFNMLDLESDSQRNLVYNLIAQEVERLLNEQEHDLVIIDGNFNKKSRREKLYSVLKDAEVFVIHCFVSDEEIIMQRMLERRKNPEILENKADSMELYYLIKNSGEEIDENEISETGINLIKFDSEKGIVEPVKIINNQSQILRDILAFMGVANQTGD